MVNLLRYYDDTGTLISQTSFVPNDVRTEDERNVLTALLLIQTGGALALQLFGIGSAYFLFVSAVPLFGALSLDALLHRGGLRVSLWTYALGMSVPLMSGTRMACITLDVFVPLVCPSHFFYARAQFFPTLLYLSDILNCRPDASVRMRLQSISLHQSSQSYYPSLCLSLRPSPTAFREACALKRSP